MSLSARTISPRASILAVLTTALALGASLVGLAGSARAETELVVRITSRGVEPRELSVPAGSLVAFTNEDDERHRLRSRDGYDGFDTGNLDPGESVAVPFDEPGTFSYLDERNDEARRWRGTVAVTAPLEPPAPAAQAAVGMLDEVFRPGTVSIAADGTVTWTNDDGDDHTVTGRGFDSGILAPGASFSHTFADPGTFVYGCLIHPEMQGSVEVAAGAVESIAPGSSIAPGASVGPGASADPAASGDPGASAGPPASGVPGASAGPDASAQPDASAGLDASAGPATVTGIAAVAIVDFAMEPPTLSVPAGTEVTFTNEGQAPHSATAVDGSFDSGVMSSGGSFAHTFETPGTFDYFCLVHPSMTGVIEVTAASGASPDASPAPSALP